MKNFKTDLQELMANNQEHLSFTFDKMAELLNTTKEDVINNHFNKAMQMFIATV